MSFNGGLTKGVRFPSWCEHDNSNISTSESDRLTGLHVDPGSMSRECDQSFSSQPLTSPKDRARRIENEATG